MFFTNSFLITVLSVIPIFVKGMSVPNLEQCAYDDLTNSFTCFIDKDLVCNYNQKFTMHFTNGSCPLNKLWHCSPQECSKKRKTVTVTETCVETVVDTVTMNLTSSTTVTEFSTETLTEPPVTSSTTVTEVLTETLTEPPVTSSTTVTEFSTETLTEPPVTRNVTFTQQPLTRSVTITETEITIETITSCDRSITLPTETLCPETTSRNITLPTETLCPEETTSTISETPCPEETTTTTRDITLETPCPEETTSTRNLTLETTVEIVTETFAEASPLQVSAAASPSQTQTVY